MPSACTTKSTSCRELDQTSTASRASFSHHAIKRAPDQQKEQQRDRGVEIGVRAMLHRLVNAHAEGEQHPSEIGTSMLVRPCLRLATRPEKYPTE